MRPRDLTLAVLVLCAARAGAATTEWRKTAALGVDGDGLVRVELPLEAVSTARPDFSDLRVFDASGAEVPYLIERRLPASYQYVSAKRFSSQVAGGGMTATADFDLPPGAVAEALRLEIPTPAFLASATVELGPAAPGLQGRPVFRQTDGPQSVELRPAAGRWSSVRVALEPVGGSPTPVVTGISARLAPRASPSARRLEAEIVEQTSDARETRIRLRLPAANLWVDSVALEARDRLFTRSVELLDRSLADGAVKEQSLGGGTVFRVLAGGAEPGERLSFDVKAQVTTREAVLRVRNGDSPPLSVSAVTLTVVPAQLVFLGKKGAYSLAVGNDAAQAPQYDLGALRASLDAAPARAASWGELVDTRGYAPREPLPGVEEEGAPIDVSDWPYRKKFAIAKPGVQTLELDYETLARERAPFASLRVVRGGKQLPFITDEAGVERKIDAALRPEKSDPRASRWTLTLPAEGLPLTYLSCSADKPLFQRRVTVTALGRDERGDAVEQYLGSAEWTRLLGQRGGDLSISIARVPPSRELSLVVENGDNPPLGVSNCRVFFRTRRLLFKASPGADAFLYYGRDNVSPPVYDLQLAAAELFAAPASAVGLGPEERLQALPWWQATAPSGAGKWIFWGALSAVVAILLLVIAKLLPEPPGEKRV